WRDGLLDYGIAGEVIDRAMELDVERDQLVQWRLARDGVAGLQRRLQPHASGRIAFHTFSRQPCRQRVDRAADLVKRTDACGIELRDLKAAPAALGHETLPMQQMQRMRHRLARHAELVRKFVLPDALTGLQGTVGDRLQDACIDLVDQIGERVERDHAGTPGNTEFRIRSYNQAMDEVKLACKLSLGFG